MIVCLCRRISDRDIERQAASGVPDFETLQDETCIARHCGRCEDCARELFDRATAKVIRVHRGTPAESRPA